MNRPIQSAFDPQKNALYIEIITPERVFFQGYVDAVTVPGRDGELGILAHHLPMVAAMAIGLLHFQQNGVSYEVTVSEGFLEVRPDRTLIFGQSVEWPDEIDLRRAQEAEIRAQEKLLRQQSMREYAVSQASLARARLRLRAGSHVNQGQ